MRKNIGLILILSLVLLSFSACAGRQSAEKEKGFYIYYLDQMQSMLVKESYKLKEQKIKDRINELLTALSTPMEDSDLACPIPAEVTVRETTLKSRRLKISFSYEYTNLTKVREALLRAAVVKTLTQLDGIDCVAFTIIDEPLADENGNAIGDMTGDSFVDDFGAEQGATAKADLVLYYATSDSAALVKEEREVHYNGNVPLEQVVLKYLSMAPNTEDAQPTLPAGVKVLSVSTQDGICYVDLDDTLLSEKVSLSVNLITYSIVNSLCELDNIKEVQILVGSGESAFVLGDGANGGYYDPDYRLVR